MAVVLSIVELRSFVILPDSPTSRFGFGAYLNGFAGVAFVP